VDSAVVSASAKASTVAQGYGGQVGATGLHGAFERAHADSFLRRFGK